MRFIYLSLFVFFTNQIFGQNSFGLAYELSFLSANSASYDYNAVVLNDNETIDSYNVRNQLGALSHGFSVRSYGRQFHSSKKTAFGYSLDIGYSFFRGSSDFLYLQSSTLNRDSIINDFDRFKLNSVYHSVRFNHYLDFHWNPSADTKITNSIGVGISAIVKGSHRSLGFDASMVNNNHPILKFVYQPQLTEKYDKLSVTYFASIDLFAMSLFRSEQAYPKADHRVPYSNIRFNSLGVRIVPRMKERKLLLPEGIID